VARGREERGLHLGVVHGGRVRFRDAHHTGLSREDVVSVTEQRSLREFALYVDSPT
jgi:hypothetical protein